MSPVKLIQKLNVELLMLFTVKGTEMFVDTLNMKNCSDACYGSCNLDMK